MIDFLYLLFMFLFFFLCFVFFCFLSFLRTIFYLVSFLFFFFSLFVQVFIFFTSSGSALFLCLKAIAFHPLSNNCFVGDFSTNPKKKKLKKVKEKKRKIPIFLRFLFRSRKITKMKKKVTIFTLAHNFFHFFNIFYSLIATSSLVLPIIFSFLRNLIYLKLLEKIQFLHLQKL